MLGICYPPSCCIQTLPPPPPPLHHLLFLLDPSSSSSSSLHPLPPHALSQSSLEHSSWLSLLVQLTILGHVIWTGDTTCWRDQLAYLASPGSMQVLCELESVQPQFISDQLWSRLVSAPLNADYLKRIISFPSFWEGLKADSVGIKALFPWRSPDAPISLDDLVVMSVLNREAFLAQLMDEVDILARSVPPEALSLITIFSGLETQKAPLLFLFDHTSITCQTSLWYLETELRNYLKASVVPKLPLHHHALLPYTHTHTHTHTHTTRHHIRNWRCSF